MTVASLRLPIRVEPLRLGFRLVWDLKLPNSLESHREEHSRELDSGKGSFSSSNDTRSIIITHMPRDPLQNRCDSLEQITVIADAPPTYLSTYSTFCHGPTQKVRNRTLRLQNWGWCKLLGVRELREIVSCIENGRSEGWHASALPALNQGF